MRTLELLQSMGAEAREHHILTLARPGGVLESGFRATGATTSFLRAKSLGNLPAAWRLARGHAVIHSHLGPLSGVFLAIPWLARTPIRIAHFRSDGEDTGPSWLGRLRRRILRSLVRAFATDILGVSPGALERGYCDRWREDGRCQVVHSGLRLDLFQRPPVTSIRDAVALPDGARVMVHVGREHPAKNRDLAIKIIIALVPVSSFHLVFVGRDDDGEVARQRRLLRTARAEERVHWLGERADVPDLLRGADVLLSTSLREGLPGAVLESIAAGTPVVASAIPGSMYLSEHFSGAVALVDLGAPADRWVSTILSTSRSTPSPEDRERALARVRESEFGQGAALEHFREIWRSSHE